MNRPSFSFMLRGLVLSCVICVAAGAAENPFGWRVGPAAWSFKGFSFFDAVDKAASLGMQHIEAFEGQRVRPDSEEQIDAGLSDEQIQAILDKLKQSNVGLTSIYIHSIPADGESCRRVFDFSRKLGVGFIVSEPAPEALDVIEKCCDEYGISLAIHNHPRGSSRYWSPEEVLAVCEGRGARIGACGDTGHWLRSGLNPAECVRKLGKRVISLHLKDLDKAAPDAHDMPWGQGCGGLEEVLRALYGMRVKPAFFAVEYESNWENNLQEIAACGQWFGESAGRIAGEATREDGLLVGWATADVTPPEPIALAGQMNKRLSKSVRDPLTVTALAMETRGPDGRSEQAVIVSCDIVSIPRILTDEVQRALPALAPGLDPRKVMMSATHTHTAPVLDETAYTSVYEVGNEPGEMKPSDYRAILAERIAKTIADAWKNREPGGMSWALAHAPVGLNRRTQYADGTTVMYGRMHLDPVLGLEGGNDPGIEMLFFWKPDQTLTGAIINIACPSQETEGLYEVSADFWHDVRTELRRRHGDGLFILPQCAPAGDISPHRMYRKDAEDIMLKRRGVSYREEVARRIADAFDDVLPTAGADTKFAMSLIHDVVELDLPEVDPPRPPFGRTDSIHPITFHVLRMGDVAMASNPFELYLDYGLRIKARSKPVLTLLVQLADMQCGYLPTVKAVAGGGYSAEKFVVGPEGGQVLVEETVLRVNYLWP